MNDELSAIPRLIAYETILAHLLARDSANSGVKLDDMHAAMVTAVSSAIEGATGRTDLAVAGERCLDSIYAHASALLSARPE